MDIRIRENELYEISKGTRRVMTHEENLRYMENKNKVEDLKREILNVYERGGGWQYGCNSITIYEMALMGIKNKLLAKQVRDVKEQQRVKRDLLSQMKTVEILYGKDSAEYNQIERQFDDLVNLDLLSRAGRFKEFFEKNNEKPTRAFYKIGKSKLHNDDTTKIRDKNGLPFQNVQKQGEHNGDFYGDLYKKKIDKMLELENYLVELDTTLGENKRALSEEEKQSLEGQFTLLELEESLDKSNLGSAAGWDGVSYLFIKKFWFILGDLLRRAVNEGVENGIMSQNFRLGIIKLIPKKGDATKVEEWRPITLLSCSYKIFSGAVANRIEKVLHKLVGRGQKGFMKNINIHMCTMNIIDNISQAWNEEEETGILCVDFNKAFDSVEHYVIEQVLKFFNFGNYMVRTVMTLLRDRQGVVLLTNGFSKNFDIKRGTPQGDRTSPYIFILCVEILILKLEDLAKENEGMNVGVNEMIRLQNDLASGIIEAYADDLTVMFKWNRNYLSLILDCIVDFGELTGLTVNVNKTQLMLVGKNVNDEGLGHTGGFTSRICELGL
jgi:hypothetical protein